MCKSKTRTLGLLEECVAEIGIAGEMSAGISRAADFLDGMEGLTHLRAASMSIQYVTECIKQLDNITGGKLPVGDGLRWPFRPVSDHRPGGEDSGGSRPDHTGGIRQSTNINRNQQ